MGKSRHWEARRLKWATGAWDIPPEDLVEADGGDVAWTRHTYHETQIGMHVVGQFDRGMSLGIVAIRCERRGGHLIPVSVCIPETPPVTNSAHAYISAQEGHD